LLANSTREFSKIAINSLSIMVMAFLQPDVRIGSLWITKKAQNSFFSAQVEKFSKQAQSSIGKCFVGSVLVAQVAFWYPPPPQTHQQDGATSSTAGSLIGADRRFVLNHHLHIIIIDDVEETLRLSLWQRPVADLASHAPFATPRFGWNAFSGHRYHSYSHALYPLEYHQPHVSRLFIIPTFHHVAHSKRVLPGAQNDRFC